MSLKIYQTIPSSLVIKEKAIKEVYQILLKTPKIMLSSFAE